MVAGMNAATHAVLRAEERHELHVLCFMKDVDVRLHEVVNACRVGDEAYALAFKLFEIVGFEHLNACFHFLCRNG